MTKMFKTTVAAESENIIKMRDMEPGQLGILVDGAHAGNYVMRTLSSIDFEVMDLTRSKASCCWITPCTLKVQLLPSGSKVTLEVL